MENISQKELFNLLNNEVNELGLDNILLGLNLMYKAFEASEFYSNTEYHRIIDKLNKDLIVIFQSTEEYRKNREIRNQLKSTFGFNAKEFEKHKISKENTIKDLINVVNTETIFYDKKVVITGIFEKYPIRDTLAYYLKCLGADVNTSISSKTNIVCVGTEAGPKKIEKINQLNQSGCNIKVINENELKEILIPIFNK
ncbi:hypothetical protein D0T49_03920 [Paludibacter sp. 221]|uniref:BRCT domain-containing protein n=1 Tax=Paludibacter sp. 221 TaxID=2302939 RepID=UPI0013D2DB85|nr:BRCT domain-containing protein [Paludibacter sp. 221]NDV46188.1 hypothetical protein [Paludibacter sp. 221]